MKNNNSNLFQEIENSFLHMTVIRLFFDFLICPILCVFVLIAVLPDNNPKLDSMLMYLPILLFWIMLLGWFYVIGISLYKKLPREHNMNINFFKFNLIYVVLYSLFVIIIDIIYKEILYNISLYIFYLYAGYSILYILYFIPKALVSVEKQRAIRFYDCADVFIIFWFFPFGILALQSRIRKIFNQ